MATRKPKAETEVKEPPVKKPAGKRTSKINFSGMTPRQIADAKGEPWVSVVSVELDPDNIGNGAFELDWNDKFISNLVRAGYTGKTDNEMVDRWFQEVCRNIVMETYEQWEANQPYDARPRVIDKRDVGNGRTEVR